MATTKQKFVNQEKVKEAATALVAFHKTRQNANELLFGEPPKIQLQISVWKITTKKSKTHKIHLPHKPHTNSFEVCLFAKDLPNMDSDLCQIHYRDLLSSRGVTNVNEVIPLTMLKKEYIPFEARRRLSKSYHLFLADSRIFRLLPPHLGKEFYKRNRYPVTVNLEKKDLKSEMDATINATYLVMTHRGSCSNVNVANTAMSAEEVTENIMAVMTSLPKIVPQGWGNVKSIHIVSKKAVSIPIYTSLVHEDWEQSTGGNEESEPTEDLVDNSDIVKLKTQLRLEKEIAKEKKSPKKAAKKTPKKRKATAGSSTDEPDELTKIAKVEKVVGARKKKSTPKIGGKKK